MAVDADKPVGALTRDVAGSVEGSGIDGDDFEAAIALVEALVDEDDVPAAWFRVAAVGGLENEGLASSAPRRLATRALAALAGRGELAAGLTVRPWGFGRAGSLPRAAADGTHAGQFRSLAFDPDQVS